ncbi:ATP-binding protein [Alistipes sp.]|uniref:sensor histidine kinase n=1 Tax=Alistipes sp. TaxID=1872444 RepID=UPI003AEFBA6C
MSDSSKINCGNSGALSDQLLDAMQTGVIFFDSDGVVVRTNQLARDDLRIARNPVGSKLAAVISIIYGNKDILPELIARLDEDAAGQIVLPRDVLMRSKIGGVQFFVTGRITRLDGGARLLSFRNVVDELTQEYMLKMALSSTKIFPWFYDMERGVMVIDARYYDYTGIPTRDYTMSMEEFSERIHPEDRAAMAEAFAQQLHGDHYPYPVPFRLLRGDGRYEWFEGQSTYLGQVEGMPYRVVGICMSTQAHKDIEEALTLAKNKAEQSDRLKSAFLANMSHEIRTPLNAIIGFTNLLSDGVVSADSEEGREYVDLINRNSDYLLTLVSDILDLSRIETGAMDFSIEEYSLGQLLTDIHRFNKHRIPEQVEFRMVLPPEELRIETDVQRLRQVLDNLLGNALKFTDKGCIELGYALADDERSVEVFVADTGRGIAEEHVEKIFERFYKVDSFMQGAGLGLPICKTIAEGLGGSITVSSRLGEGSRFSLKLPVRQPSEP